MSDSHTLIFDIADPEKAGRYPEHGWATNSRGLKLLWLPVLQLLGNAEDIRQQKGLAPISQSPSVSHNSRAFNESVEKLALVLREIHFHRRQLSQIQMSAGDLDGLAGAYRSHEIIPLFVDLAYSYFRRLADALILASRPLMFEHYLGAPQQFRKLRALVQRPADLTALNPICEIRHVEEAFREHGSWFDTVRSERAWEGIRDVMEHKAVTSALQSSQVDGGPVEVAFSLATDHGLLSYGLDLIATVRHHKRIMQVLHKPSSFHWAGY